MARNQVSVGERKAKERARQALRAVRRSRHSAIRLRDLLTALGALRGKNTTIPKSLKGLLLDEQPFDRELLCWSPLFRQSRQIFVEGGGRFAARLLSSPRTLSSATLLENEIEYTPMETELLWAATDPEERKNPEHLLELRRFMTTLFHETNHRLLWALLPPPARGRGSVCRYLNFCESLVVALDMALGDELGPELSEAFYLCGATYDPGTSLHAEGLVGDAYRRYLCAAAYSTWLYMEGFEPEPVVQHVQAAFAELGPYAERAARRALNIDPQFVRRTSPLWQGKHWKLVEDFLWKRVPGRKRRGEKDLQPIDLPVDPRDGEIVVEGAEQTLRWFGL